MKACMGGWGCSKREACDHYAADDRSDPADRLCDPGADGMRDGFPIRPLRRAAGTWERASLPSLHRPADVFDGPTA